MRVRKFISVVATLALGLVCGCGGKADIDSAPLLAIPSRAVAVAHFTRVDKALPLLVDSTSRLRAIDYGSLHNSEMAFCYLYSASLVPVLVIDAGHADADTSHQVEKILQQAAEAGIASAYTGDKLKKRSLLILSTSQAEVNESLLHLEEHTSILDAPGFRQAIERAEGKAGVVIMRGTGTRRWLPKSFLSDVYQRFPLIKFIESFSEWTAGVFDSYDASELELQYLPDPLFGHFSSVLENIGGGESKLAGVLPKDFSFAMDMPVADFASWQSAYQKYLDVKALLPRNKKTQAIIKESCGITPVQWVKNNKIKEVALVRFGESMIILARCGKKLKQQGIVKDNDCPGAVPVLFGDAFRLEDQSRALPCGHWLVIGSEEALQAFIAADKGVKGCPIPKKDCKFAVCTPQWQIADSGDKIKLNIWN